MGRERGEVCLEGAARRGGARLDGGAGEGGHREALARLLRVRRPPEGERGCYPPLQALRQGLAVLEGEADPEEGRGLPDDYAEEGHDLDGQRARGHAEDVRRRLVRQRSDGGGDGR